MPDATGTVLDSSALTSQAAVSLQPSLINAILVFTEPRNHIVGGEPRQ